MAKHRRKTVERGHLRSRRKLREEREKQPEEILSEQPASDESLPGMVLAVPDNLWGFTAVGREDHPGICTNCLPAAMQVTLVKGRDAVTDRGPARTRYVIQPSRLNGLRKLTSFELTPLYRPLRRVWLLVPNRRMGTLEQSLFDELRQRLIALFPAEGK